MGPFSRKIVGWAMQEHMQVELVSAAPKKWSFASRSPASSNPALRATSSRKGSRQKAPS
jgi:hypothetical protein